MSDINGDGEIRIFGKGCGDGSTSADLFLGGGYTDNFCLKRAGIFCACFSESTSSFENGVGPCFVIKGSGDSYGAVDELKALVVYSGIAYGNEGFGFGFAFYADIDPNFVGLWDFFTIFRTHEVNGSLASDTFDHTFLGEDGNTSS